MTGGLEMAYTDFLQLVQARQSDRSYDKERPVEPEKLERVLEACTFGSFGLQRTTLEVCGHHRQGTGSKSRESLLLAWE